MAGLTLAQARDLVSKKLNDVAKNRYQDATHIDPALLEALESTLIDYTEGEGADYLLSPFTATTDANGQADFSGDDLLLVRHAKIVEGTRTFPIQRRSLVDGYTKAQAANKSIEVWGIAVPALSGTASDPLFSHEHAFKAFDKLVVVRAALELAGNENRAKNELQREEMKLWRTVQNHATAAGPRTIPKSRSGMGYGFVYLPSSQVLQLITSNSRF